MLKAPTHRSDEQRVTRTDAVELSDEVHASLLGGFVRADRIAEARGRLRRGEAPGDDELARAIVASSPSASDPGADHAEQR